MSKQVKPDALARTYEDMLTHVKFKLPMRIANASQQADVVEAITQAKKVGKLADSAMKAATEPLRSQQRVIESAWKPIIKAADELVARGKAAVEDWLDRQEEARQKLLAEQAEALAKAEAEAKAAEARLEAATTTRQKNAALAKIETAESAMLKAAAPPAEVATTIVTDSGAASQRLGQWTYRQKDLKVVPSCYLMLNHAAVMGAIRAGTREIPGLEIYQPKRVVVGDLKV